MRYVICMALGWLVAWSLARLDIPTWLIFYVALAITAGTLMVWEGKGRR
jgi:hypothetical protein